jgi:xanthine dehydrogenase iron-sulfur cluster and FAD-binding subunit A
VPWSIDDALTKLYNIIEAPNTYHTGAISNWQDQTINRTLDVFQGKGEDLARNTLDYRKHVARNILYRRYI